jgi:acetyl esterase/lipase
VAVYRALLDTHPGTAIALVGESAGGNLVLVVALRAMAEGIALPICVCSVSPVTTMAEEIPSRARNTNADLVVPGNVNEQLRASYIGTSDARHPDVSPLYGDYAGFPPLQIIVDTSEALYDDSALLAEKARAAGVKVSFQESSEAFHSLVTLAHTTPESEQQLRDIIAFIKDAAVSEV